MSVAVPRRVVRSLSLLLVTVSVAVAACTTPDPDSSPTAGAGTGTTTPTPSPTDTPTPAPTDTPSPSPTVATPSPSPSATASAPPSPAPPGWDELAAGFEALTATLVDPRTDELLVTELGGRIRTLDGDGVLDLSDRVTVGRERGLLDATTTPDGQRLLVHYSGADGQTVVSSFPLLDDPRDGLADPDDETELLTFEQPAANHNGGSIVFGPDGWLYLALGDGGLADDAFGNGADPSTPLGAILRLDVTSDAGEVAPAPDNPFLEGGGDPRVWAHGLRNPWRIATDGDRWFVADVGQDAVEEVTIVPADSGPHDLGWPEWEGDRCRLEPCGDDSLQPVATLTHDDDGACSLIGGAVAELPAADAGRYFYTDLCDTRVWRLDPDTGTVSEDASLPSGARPFALDLDLDGRVVALMEDGRVLVRDRG